MVQAGLTALDTWMASEWRERQRSWRRAQVRWREEELAFRAEERRVRQLERQYLELNRRRRDDDIRQRRVDNSRYLWGRFTELNRRDVEEKSEQLRSFCWMTALITSFTFTVPVEFNFGFVPTARLVAYAICAAIVPCLMTISTILSMYLLGSILKMGKWFVSELAEEEFMVDCREYAENSRGQGSPPAPVRTFERFWECRFIKFTFENTIAILFSAIIIVFFFIWLGIQVTWGSYLQKSQHDYGSSSALANRSVYISSDNPFKWHTCSELQLEPNSIVVFNSNDKSTEAENVTTVETSTNTLPI